jgi:hypothetical protein
VEEYHSGTGWTEKTTVDGQITRCRVTELKKGEDYSWHVYAVDESGSHSEPSESVSYYMDTPQGLAHNLILGTFVSSVFSNMIITCKRGSAAYGVKDYMEGMVRHHTWKVGEKLLLTHKWLQICETCQKTTSR